MFYSFIAFEYLVATDAKVFYEVVLGDKVLKKEWISLKKEQKVIEIDVKEELRGGFQVNLLMTYDNRVYSESMQFAVPYSNKQLKAIDTDEALIATALMAAPEESRSRCKVIGYNMAGEFVTMRDGDNEFIVLADNPKQDGFNAACYHKARTERARVPSSPASAVNQYIPCGDRH